jgi:hypothetical protein
MIFLCILLYMGYESGESKSNITGRDEYGPQTFAAWFLEQVTEAPEPSPEMVEAVANFHAMEAMPTEELCRILNEQGYTGPPQIFHLPKDML